MSDKAAHKAFAQDVAALMRKHDAYATDIRYRLQDDGPFEEGRVTYTRGRHRSPGSLNVIVTTHLGDFAEVPAQTPVEES